MEAPDLALTHGANGDPRRPFVLFGLGYLALCVAAIWIDHKVRLRRARKKRAREEDRHAPPSNE